MKKQVIKDFILYPDIMVMGLLFFIGLGIVLPSLDQWQLWGFLASGMIAYSLSEYLIHRFLFHMKPPKNPTLLKMIKRLHYDHHVKPDDLHLLFLPLWYSAPIILISALAVYFFTGNFLFTISFVTGIIGFLLFYEWKHYIAHRPITPLTPWGRWMKKVHMLHHYKNENYWYGVTHPLYDVLLGTFEDEKNVEKSETARNLESHDKKD
ncbi:sterol desaturase family protein [Caldalkalibacillus mannanilyticus]|uniref:sterol desaturase family protein n=1 Tax=Caldalkalibacillus mannanilyticus TaxID=1418 RepID=UPI0004680DFB|nr:sterol desaturase family protein [Caldalkalibacillus mannanilyticus]